MRSAVRLSPSRSRTVGQDGQAWMRDAMAQPSGEKRAWREDGRISVVEWAAWRNGKKRSNVDCCDVIRQSFTSATHSGDGNSSNRLRELCL